ncbi:MAG TPA: hypothetical protein VF680_17390 [Allosphingosinicella sp.]|jgi:hypothetical protein
MGFEADVITKYESVFGGRLFWDTSPEGWTTTDRNAPFGIVQQVGGVERIYLDNTPSALANARLMFWVWGARRTEVCDALRALRKAVLDSNTATWVATPEGAPSHDFNEALKLRGSRQDFSIWYPDPLA